MGATIAGRGWRICTLLNNPLMTAGGGGGGNKNSSTTPRIELARQFTLRTLSALSGCDFNIARLLRPRGKTNSRGGGVGRPIRFQIKFGQVMRATLFMIVPQIVWQIVVVLVPILRSSRNFSYYDNELGMIIGKYQCQSSVGLWPICVGIVLTVLPFAIANLLNIRPKSELDQLPDIIDDREHLKMAIDLFIRVIVVTAPIIGLTEIIPAARAYATICAVLVLPLACCYHIAHIKLSSTKLSPLMQPRQRMLGGAAFVNNGDANGHHSAALALRMAEMYSRIGRTEETVQLVDETLNVFRKGNNSTVGNLGQSDGRVEVGSGFTNNDLKLLDGDELQMIIQLLRLKGSALTKLKGPEGFAMSAKLNIGKYSFIICWINNPPPSLLPSCNSFQQFMCLMHSDALKIFENCPAANKMKDTSVIFPIYNTVGVQLKGGVIDQDDECSLERDLAERFCHEAQLQVYHYARALANLAPKYTAESVRMMKHSNALKL